MGRFAVDDVLSLGTLMYEGRGPLHVAGGFALGDPELGHFTAPSLLCSPWGTVGLDL